MSDRDCTLVSPYAGRDVIGCALVGLSKALHKGIALS